MPPIYENQECPNCGEKFTVIEFTKNYSILHDGHVVTNCPNCLKPLIYHDGKLIIDAEMPA